MIPALTEQPIKTNVINTSIDVTTTNPTVIPDPFHVTVDNPTTIPNPVPVSFSTDYVQKVVNETNNVLKVSNDKGDNTTNPIYVSDINHRYQVYFDGAQPISSVSGVVQVDVQNIPMQIVNYTGTNLNVLSKGEYRYIYSKKFLSTEATISITLPINILANDLIRLNDVFVDITTGYLNLKYSENPNINPDDFYVYNETSTASIFVNKSNDKCLSTGFIKIINNVDAGNVLLKLSGPANVVKFFDVEVYRLS